MCVRVVAEQVSRLAPSRDEAIHSQSVHVSLGVNGIPSDLVDQLRDSGHAVGDELGISTCRCGDLVDRAARFVDAALAGTRPARSGRAYIRLSCSRGCLFVEVTDLRPGTFHAVMSNDAAMVALDELRAWAHDVAEDLAIERGPRDQFRITMLLGPTLGRDKGCTELASERLETV
jgi:hypothetical protein